MLRTMVALAGLLAASLLWAADEKPTRASFDYNVARAHEIKPHRRNIPLEGVRHFHPNASQIRRT